MREIPLAWRTLVEEKDDLLIELIVEKVKSGCDFKPSEEQVTDFLIQHTSYEQTSDPDSNEDTNNRKDLSRDTTTRQKNNKYQRAKKGEATQHACYELPILKAISDLGGRGEIDEVLKRVQHDMRTILKEIDHLALKSGAIRWRENAQWVRFKMVKDGRLKKDSSRGIWEITEKGRKWLVSTRKQ